MRFTDHNNTLASMQQGVAINKTKHLDVAGNVSLSGYITVGGVTLRITSGRRTRDGARCTRAAGW